MKYIIFKYKKRSLNLKIKEEADETSLINTIKYCLKYLKISKSNIGLRDITKWLEYDAEKCKEPIIEESLIVDLRNLDENLFSNIDNNEMDEELVESFNDIIGGKKYEDYSSIIIMILLTVMMKMSNIISMGKREEIILLVAVIGILIWQLYNERWTITELKE
ncbi:MAG: hypothetical protein ACRDDY_14830, partial [Clostridium sp.]|uniref:hypothetical protein n=1 Tax=Clostridium sp. TaxID=1506 RepID=UPI003EE76501